ncbi:21866_t:CDS:2 [Gigaspora rosea]|nr:21866_t:CDS:2 [Gigaspora rosea]
MTSEDCWEGTGQLMEIFFIIRSYIIERYKNNERKKNRTNFTGALFRNLYMNFDTNDKILPLAMMKSQSEIYCQQQSANGDMTARVLLMIQTTWKGYTNDTIQHLQKTTTNYSKPRKT